MGSVTMRFGEYHEGIFKALIKRGVVKTKSEAMRMGVEELGRKYGVVEEYRGVKIYRNPHGKYTLEDLLKKASFRGEPNLSSRIDEILAEPE